VVTFEWQAEPSLLTPDRRICRPLGAASNGPLVRQADQNNDARTSLLSWRGGAAAQARTHCNCQRLPTRIHPRPLQCLVGEFFVEDLFLSQAESHTGQVHGIDPFCSPAAPAIGSHQLLRATTEQTRGVRREFFSDLAAIGMLLRRSLSITVIGASHAETTRQMVFTIFSGVARTR
jgi:hypothetical protein